MIPAICALIAIVVGAIANIFFTDDSPRTELYAWLTTIAMILLLGGCIGRAISGRWDGVLIDSRNRVALSRLQMAGWTVLVISALITFAASNLHLHGNSGALNINIPQEMLLAMGIAAASLAATPALLSLKGVDPASGVTLTASNAAPQGASWLDIFRGDEQSDANLPDLSKIQQFLITLALVGTYAVAIGNMILDPAAYPPPPAPPVPPVPPPPPILAGSYWTLPTLSPNFIWLLGISHAGYLTYKAATKPASQSPNPTS